MAWSTRQDPEMGSKVPALWNIFGGEVGVLLQSEGGGIDSRGGEGVRGVELEK